MASAKGSFVRAITAHREALGLLAAIRERLDRLEADSVHSAESAQEQTALAVQLERSAAVAAPNWLGASWRAIDSERFPLESDARPGDRVMIRVGDAQPVPGVGFPVIVPFLGVGHLVIDRDAREPAVAGLLRSVLARLLAAFPAGMLRILAVDGGALGAPLAPFRALVPAGVMREPVTELDEFRNLLDEAEEQVRRVQSKAWTDPDVIVIAAAALPPGCTRADFGRLSALAHAGPNARVHLLLAGYPPGGSSWEQRPQLERSTVITTDPGRGGFRVGDPFGETFGADGRGLNVPVALDPSPPIDLLDELCRRVALRAESEGVLEFDDLVPEQVWTESSVTGLRTVVGRIGRGDAVLSLDDATPHWLVGGRTGSGKTVFLLDVLYGLAARYSPDELSLFLLDFKEGVSFTEFMPTERDPTWLPHARTVGVESDREYGVAVLTELVREMNRRAALMKRVGVTNLAHLRASSPDHLPRIVCVIDEFHVLLQGKDETSKRAVDLLEEVARKGRSFGVHLILASQSVSGIEALFIKGPSVFQQFGLRIAMSGAGGVLNTGNRAADALPVGQVVLNDAGGRESGNRRARFPDADAHSIALLRHRLWQMRTPGSPPPAMFVGYAEYGVDSVLPALPVGGRRRVAVLGRNVDVGMTTASFPLEAAPGRHLAVVGTSPVGADLLDAVAVGLARQHEPGSASFYLCSLVGQADEQVDELADRLKREGHLAEALDLPGYRDALGRLAAETDVVRGQGSYLFVYGADVANSLLKQKLPSSPRSGLDDLRLLLREGPTRGTHVFGWWRGLRQLADDLGAAGRDDVAGIVALNVRGNELGLQIGQANLAWTPRPNRALLIDRQADTRSLIMPFVRPGRYAEES